MNEYTITIKFVDGKWIVEFPNNIVHCSSISEAANRVQYQMEQHEKDLQWTADFNEMQTESINEAKENGNWDAWDNLD